MICLLFWSLLEIVLNIYKSFLLFNIFSRIQSYNTCVVRSKSFTKANLIIFWIILTLDYIARGFINYLKVTVIHSLLLLQSNFRHTIWLHIYSNQYFNTLHVYNEIVMKMMVYSEQPVMYSYINSKCSNNIFPLRQNTCNTLYILSKRSLRSPNLGWTWT